MQEDVKMEKTNIKVLVFLCWPYRRPIVGAGIFNSPAISTKVTRAGSSLPGL
jgi:hypothetical protein